MKDLFCNYEQSLALKEIGFDEVCFGAYGAWGFMSSNDVNSLSDEVTQEDLDNKGYNEEDGVCLAPLKSQIFKWFRDKHKLHSSIGTFCLEEFNPCIQNSRSEILYPISNLILSDGKKNPWEYDTYEEAESACIDKLIEIVKGK
jgi:hypothetical protein